MIWGGTSCPVGWEVFYEVALVAALALVGLPPALIPIPYLVWAHVFERIWR